MGPPFGFRRCAKSFQHRFVDLSAIWSYVIQQLVQTHAALLDPWAGPNVNVALIVRVRGPPEHHIPQSAIPGQDTMTINHGVWSHEEHDRFLEAIKMYPEGPWRLITQHVGSRSVRQVQTHAQKYHEKIARRMRGLRKERTKWARLEHRIDENLLQICKQAEGYGVYRPEAGSPTTTDVHIKSEDVHIKSEPTTEVCRHSWPLDGVQVAEYLPSFDESLDFLIECLSD